MTNILLLVSNSDMMLPLPLAWLPAACGLSASCRPHRFFGGDLSFGKRVGMERPSSSSRLKKLPFSKRMYS